MQPRSIAPQRFHFQKFFPGGASNFLQREKINLPVDFPLEGLDITPFVRGGVPQGRAPPVYDCIAVSNHMGGMGGGHYTAYARRGEGAAWFEFNDSSVRALGDDPRAKIVSPDAYIVFYRLRE